MNSKEIFYPDFDYPASQLSVFSLCIDLFIISLKNGEIVRFKPTEIAHFKEWLNRNKVRDIALDNGIPHNYKKTDLSKSSPGSFNLINKNNRDEKRTNN